MVLTVFGAVEGTRECVEIEIIDDDTAERLENFALQLRIINDSFVDYTLITISDDDGKLYMSGDSTYAGVDSLFLFSIHILSPWLQLSM